MVVRNAEDHALVHGRVLAQGVFHIHGIDVGLLVPVSCGSR
jgi:hypothetical protein